MYRLKVTSTENNSSGNGLKWLEVRAEYLEATLGLVKRLEICRELIRE